MVVSDPEFGCQKRKQTNLHKLIIQKNSYVGLEISLHM